MSDTNKKCLIAYYSRKGQNYLNGRIVTLSTGNTEVVAQKIRAITHGDLFEIETVQAYPANYHQTTEVAKEEKRQNARPKLTSNVSNMDNYDVVYLGYPNWWGTFPMAVFTFLESHDFAGKTIIPFCTHEGSGLGSSERDLKKHCPTATLKSGIAIRGGSVADADNAIFAWLQKQ